MRIFEIIKKTVLTEKTYKQMEGKRKFVFEVAKNATKSEIKYAFEKLFEIKVEAINTKNMDGKPKSMGRYSGRKNHRKIAIITVKPGQNLDILMQDENAAAPDNEIIKENITNKKAKMLETKDASEVVEVASKEVKKTVKSAKAPSTKSKTMKPEVNNKEGK